jgi:hypothetical protein
MIRGVSAITPGIHAMAALKWPEFTCAGPASSWNASASTNWCGLSTLSDHSKKMLPGSLRVAWVKGSTRVSRLHGNQHARSG